MRRALLVVVVAGLVAGACGGAMSLDEYATRGEDLTVTVIGRLNALDEEWAAQTPTAERARVYWEERIEAREDFYAGIQELEPPDGLFEVHELALDVFARLVDAEKAMAAQVAAAPPPSSHWEWWNTPEGKTARAIDNEGIAICRAAQESFDATQQREALADTPWIPGEMKEVVRVAFGCPDFLEE